jgi:hypothetical protein
VVVIYTTAPASHVFVGARPKVSSATVEIDGTTDGIRTNVPTYLLSTDIIEAMVDLCARTVSDFTMYEVAARVVMTVMLCRVKYVTSLLPTAVELAKVEFNTVVAPPFGALTDEQNAAASDAKTYLRGMCDQLSGIVKQGGSRDSNFIATRLYYIGVRSTPTATFSHFKEFLLAYAKAASAGKGPKTELLVAPVVARRRMKPSSMRFMYALALDGCTLYMTASASNPARTATDEYPFDHTTESAIFTSSGGVDPSTVLAASLTKEEGDRTLLGLGLGSTNGSRILKWNNATGLYERQFRAPVPEQFGGDPKQKALQTRAVRITGAARKAAFGRGGFV